MIVCVCNQVSDRDIRREVRGGMDFSDVQLEMGVATCCGCCEAHARALVTECQQEQQSRPSPGGVKLRLACAA